MLTDSVKTNFRTKGGKNQMSKIIKVDAREELVSNGHITTLKELDYKVTEEMLSCFPRYQEDKDFDEEEVKELINEKFWDIYETRDLKLTPFYNRTVGKQDVNVQFSIHAEVEVEEAPNTKFLFDFEVDRDCEGDYGDDKSQIIEELEKARETYLKDDLPNRAKKAITDTLKKVKTVFISPKPPLTELPNVDDVLNTVKHQLYKVILSKEFDSSIEDLLECFQGIVRSKKEFERIESALGDLQKFVEDSRTELENYDRVN